MTLQRYVSKELTHFVGQAQPSDDARYDLLVKILTTGWLIAPGTLGVKGEPRENRISWSYQWEKKLSDSEGLFSSSAVCFCDIPIADLGVHVSKYGRFGLSFRKEFLIAKGAAPVFYWPNGVRYIERTRAEWLDALADEIREMHKPPPPGVLAYTPPPLSKLQAFFENFVLPFLKPFDETKADEDPSNYYMEREWRTLASIRFALPDVYRVILPEAYSARFRSNVPTYMGQVTFTDST